MIRRTSLNLVSQTHTGEWERAMQSRQRGHQNSSETKSKGSMRIFTEPRAIHLMDSGRVNLEQVWFARFVHEGRIPHGQECSYSREDSLISRAHMRVRGRETWTTSSSMFSSRAAKKDDGTHTYTHIIYPRE